MVSIVNTTELEKLIDLAKKKGALEAEIIQRKWTENPISFENNKLKSLESNQSSGIGIRLIKNNKIGIASSTNPEAFESVVDSAIESSEYGPKAEFQLSKDSLEVLPSAENLQNFELPLETLVEKGMNVIEDLGSLHKDLLVSGGFDLSYGETIYLNSNGVSGKKAKRCFSTSFYAHLVRDNDFLGIYDGNADLDDFPDEKVISQKIKEKLINSFQLYDFETNKYPVLFTPRAVGSIFSYTLAVILSGKAIQQGISPLINKLGEKVFDEKFSFIENPEIGTSKTSFDDEGIKTEKKTLIKNGIVNSFYFDLNTASKTRNKTTGNGFKGGLATAPIPGLTSLLIEAGDANYSEIIQNTEELVVVDQLLGAGQSNTLAGEFSVGIDLGFKYKKGKLQGRIKNCMIAGNIFDILGKIAAISKEQECLSGSNFFPAILIENLTVAGK